MPKRIVKKLGKKGSLVLPDFSRLFFIVVVIVIFYLFFKVIGPFFEVLIFAALIAVVFNPVYKWFEKVLKGYKSLAAFLTTSIIFLLFLIPLVFFVIFIAQEAVAAYQLLTREIVNLDLSNTDFGKLNQLPWVGDFFRNISEKYGFQDFMNSIEIDIVSIFTNLGETLTNFLVAQTGAILSKIGNTVIGSFILLLTIFFFFRDGTEFVSLLKKISPLPQKHENEVERKLKETTHGIVLGNFGTSLIQGITGGIGFAIAGVQHGVFWTTLMIFASLIPYFGASVIWAPVALGLILTGDEPLWGWFLGFWGLFAVSSVDNIVRPFLIGGSARMHPLPTFLVVLGGIFIFGIKGIVFGPLILSLTITVLHIYQMEYKEVLGSQPE